MGGRGSSGAASSDNALGAAKRKIPDLQGSEKQIAWARDIITMAYNNLDIWEEKANSPGPGGEQWKSLNPVYDAKAIRVVREYLNLGFSQDFARKASWVIENRKRFTANAVSKMVLEEVKKGAGSKAIREMKKQKKK